MSRGGDIEMMRLLKGPRFPTADWPLILYINANCG